MQNNEFNYTYSAPTEEQKREIMSIREQYGAEASCNEKLNRLRKLDALVKRTATAASLCFGIVGTLLFGLGMSMILEWSMLLFGSLISFAGLIPVIGAYPIYNAVFKRNKKRYGEEILKLSEELLGESQ